MSLKYLARHALTLPPHIALAKSAAYAGRIIRSNMRQFTEWRRCSYQTVGEDVFHRFLGEFAIDFPAVVSNMIIEHRFNLLGSGWVKVEQTPGVGQLSSGNRARSGTIRELIDTDYRPIDWQLDFKSGYRWREDRLSGTLHYGHAPGVDVKLPWELARLQHLPWLALSRGEAMVREFRNQVLDFAAANPPGYGINWLCTMDVAIRTANILAAYDLFVGQGVKFDDAFLGELHALILAHGKHIAGNLEWHELHRANHYLANITGLLYVAAYLPRTAETDTWLAFSIQQLIKEVERQFTPDGANFEASTSYHRLSSEMTAYATALVLGLPKDKKAALAEFDHRQWQYHPCLDPAPIKMFPIPGADEVSPFPDWYFERLERMADFSMHVTKPNGHIAQIGDNDSGRFFKLCPSFAEVDGEPREQHLDHRATVAAINGLFGRHDLADFAGPEAAVEMLIVSALADGHKIKSSIKPGENPVALGRVIDDGAGDDSHLTVIGDTVIMLPDREVLIGLTTFCYPDFGLYIWRSPRLFLSVRCGPIGQNGNGGHAHNDQLAIELTIDGEDWIADPGTYLYTPSAKDRDAYRSVQAHSAPKIGKGEPARLDLGLFRLEDRAHARCLRFDPDGFEGMHAGYGIPLRRSIALQAEYIHIIDRATITEQHDVAQIVVADGEALRKAWNLSLPFSPGYGMRGQ